MFPWMEHSVFSDSLGPSVSWLCLNQHTRFSEADEDLLFTELYWFILINSRALPYSQSYGYSSPVWMWELDHRDGWLPKNWCFWTVVLEKTLESPLDCKEIKPVNSKGNKPWIFIGRTDAEALILWPPDAKSWLIRKFPDAGKDWGQEETGTTEDEMVGWHPWLNGCQFEQALRDGEGQGTLACCSPWGHKGLDTIEQPNNNNKIIPWLCCIYVRCMCVKPNLHKK